MEREAGNKTGNQLRRISRGDGGLIQTMSIYAKQHQFWGGVIAVLLTFASAAIGAAASVQAADFYAHLTRPDWAPPSGVFGPVWSVLYLLMALAAWLAWRSAPLARTRGALVLYLSQLVLNALWSWLFFGWHRGAAAMTDILALWIAIAATTAAFWKLRPVAGALMLPYWAWVTFAAGLNYSIWQLNPITLG